MSKFAAILPSRKIIAFVLMPALTIVIVWFVMNYKPRIEQAAQLEERSLSQVLAQGKGSVQEIDTDGDGLKDWEETLYGSDPDNVDTDGDGVYDGAEVRAGRDPLIPGDEVEESVDVDQQVFVYYRDDPSLSRTDVLARDIFSTYTQLRNSETLGTDLADRAIDDAISNNILLREDRPYSNDSFQVVSNTSQNKASYRLGYQEAAESLRGVDFYELELLGRYLEFGDQEALLELNKNIEIYKDFLEEFSKVRVPEEIAAVHLDVLNNYANIIFTLENLANPEEDPLTTLLYTEKYLDDERVLFTSLRALALYFNSN